MNNLNDIFFAPAANQDLTYEQILEDVQRYFAENHAGQNRFGNLRSHYPVCPDPDHETEQAH